MSATQDLLDWLRRHTIIHDVCPKTGGIVVPGSLDLQHTPMIALPDGLIVRASLDLTGSAVRGLPPGLSIGHSLRLANSQVRHLPDGLCIPGNLDLRSVPITALPCRLQVGGDLLLWDSRIQRFPEDLRVGGQIFPPKTLCDVPAFMESQPDRVVLHLTGSSHQQLALRTQLAPFPDLWRVLLSIDGGCLVLERDPGYGYTVVPGDAPL